MIPAYNAKSTLYRTLLSIATQKNCNYYHVFIINDCSLYDYQEFVQYFSRYMDIKEIKLDKNFGPGKARSIGIKNSNSKYIMFIDSDDYLYDANVLDEMCQTIDSSAADLLVSNFIYERDGERTIKENNLVWLHGKIYRRQFLEENHIDFNSTRANEDNGFNRLILLLNPKIRYLNRITYVYSENPNSITRKENRLYKLNGLEGFTYNMNWAIREGIKRNCNIKDALEVAMMTLVSMYYYYLELYDEYDVEKIIKWSVDTKKIYDKYNNNYIKEIEIAKMIEMKENEYQGKNLNKVIDFKEFLNKISN